MPSYQCFLAKSMRYGRQPVSQWLARGGNSRRRSHCRHAGRWPGSISSLASNAVILGTGGVGRAVGVLGTGGVVSVAGVVGAAGVVTGGTGKISRSTESTGSPLRVRLASSRSAECRSHGSVTLICFMPSCSLRSRCRCARSAPAERRLSVVSGTHARTDFSPKSRAA